jgi:hypothetical protein
MSAISSIQTMHVMKGVYVQCAGIHIQLQLPGATSHTASHGGAGERSSLSQLVRLPEVREAVVFVHPAAVHVLCVEVKYTYASSARLLDASVHHTSYSSDAVRTQDIP